MITERIYQDILQYVNENIRKAHHDAWIKWYIYAWLCDNNMKEEQLTPYIVKFKVNKYLLKLERRILMNELEITFNDYKLKENSRNYDSIEVLNVAYKLERIAKELERVS